jgi:hypothetical protein
VHTLTPSPALPRKREREQTEFALALSPHTNMLQRTDPEAIDVPPTHRVPRRSTT